jgi:hypothetical protein
MIIHLPGAAPDAAIRGEDVTRLLETPIMGTRNSVRSERPPQVRPPLGSSAGGCHPVVSGTPSDPQCGPLLRPAQSVDCRAPGRTLAGNPQNQLNNFLRQRRPPNFIPALAVVPVPGNELAMPTEDRIRSHDVGQFVEHFPAEGLAFDGQTPPLVVVEQDSAPSELLS